MQSTVIVTWVLALAGSSALAHGRGLTQAQPSAPDEAPSALAPALVTQLASTWGSGPHQEGLRESPWLQQAAAPLEQPADRASGKLGQPWAPAPAPDGADRDASFRSFQMDGQGSVAWMPDSWNGSSAASAGNVMDASSPCDHLKGSPAEWMRHGGALGFACAQQVQPLWQSTVLMLFSPTWQCQESASGCHVTYALQRQGY